MQAPIGLPYRDINWTATFAPGDGYVGLAGQQKNWFVTVHSAVANAWLSEAGPRVLCPKPDFDR